MSHGKNLAQTACVTLFLWDAPKHFPKNVEMFLPSHIIWRLESSEQHSLLKTRRKAQRRLRKTHGQCPRWVADGLPDALWIPFTNLTSMNWPQRQESRVFSLKQTFIRTYEAEHEAKTWSKRPVLIGGKSQLFFPSVLFSYGLMQKRLCLTTTQYKHLLGDVMIRSVSAINCVLFWRGVERNHASILQLYPQNQRRKRGDSDLASGNCRALVPSEVWRNRSCSWGSCSGLETGTGSVHSLSWCLPTMDLNQLVTPE